MATFLLAVNRIVRGVEIENQFLGRLRKRGDELIEQDTVRSDGDLAISAAFETTKGRAGCRLPLLLQGGLQGQILAQPVMVVEVFVALAQTENALPKHLLRAVFDEIRIAWIGQHIGHRFEQAELAFNLAQQQQATVRGHVAAINADVNLAATQLRKQVSLRGTIWHRRNLLC